MSRPLVYAVGDSPLAARMLPHLGAADAGVLTVRRFPDGESLVRLETSPAGRDVVFVGSLDDPDPKLMALLLALQTARELGASSVGLVAPYLCYMRQDQRFHEGEAVATRVFPRVLGRFLDWLVTVDPHLHRVHALDEIYDVPNRVVHAAPAVAAWIAANVQQPLIVGPDEESGQWVTAVARRAGAPSVVLSKVRHGDRDVEVSVPDVERWRQHTPVLVDDIVSTGRTMVETLGHLHRAGLRPAVCVGVHALFAGDALEALRAAGAARVVSCDTVVHETNAISMALPLADAVRDVLVSM